MERKKVVRETNFKKRSGIGKDRDRGKKERKTEKIKRRGGM